MSEFLYRLRSGDGALLYVGITRDWPARMKQHQTDKPWWSEVLGVELVRMDCTRRQIEAIERAVIRSEQPTHNKQHAVETPCVDPARFVTDDWPNSENHVLDVGDEVRHGAYGVGTITHRYATPEGDEIAVIDFFTGVKHVKMLLTRLELL